VNVAKHVLLLLLAFLVQTTWIDLFAVFELQPDLLVLVLVYVALAVGPLEATVLGFCVGFLQDVYLPVNLGVNALAKSIVGFGVGYGRTGIMADQVQVQIGLVFGAVLVHDLIYYVGDHGLRLAEVPLFWLRYSLGRAFYTSLIALLVTYALLLRRRFLPV
jgi:rod shape-determining protein MreD